ncbi:hypothetical protein QQ045_016797 [Rhodiola kirilowii]
MCIRDPALFYLQKVLGGTLFARDNGGDKVTFYDMICLDALDRGQSINFCRLAYKIWKHYPSTGLLACGGMITHMLRQLHEKPSLKSHENIPPAYCDIDHFSRAIRRRARGREQCTWTYPDDPRYHTDMPTDRRRTPTAGDRAESSSAAAR